MIASGQLSRAWVTDLLASMRASDPKLGSLASYERGVRSDASYSLAREAVQRLIQKTGSAGSLETFCRRVGEGTPWRDAFAQAFGVTLDAFYAEFEAAR
jgi:nitroreductase